MIIQADATRLPIADQSADLVFGSPPYCDARLYLEDGENLGVSRNQFEWVEWMLLVTREALRVTKGAVIWVCAGVTRKRNYWPACEGLLWEAHKAGILSECPVYWKRIGIPGSGGDQWFRKDIEYCLCFKREAKLPWSDNLAMGHTPYYAAGGAMCNRTKEGGRVNDPWGKRNRGSGLSGRNKNGTKKRGSTCGTSRRSNGERKQDRYALPAIANPGNLIDTGVSGGGNMGDELCHENEAPFPEELAEWFIRSLCPPGGIVLDPFSGSGTTAKVAVQTDRRYIASDLRMSQCELTRRRLKAGVPLDMF